MNWSIFKKSLIGLTIGLSTVALTTGCSKSSDDAASSSGSSSLTISGSLGSDPTSKPFGSLSVGTLAFSDLELYALCFTDPPTVGSVDLGTDGSFSLSLAGASGAECTLIFRYKTGTTNSGKTVGTVKFVDDSKKDLNGNSKETSSVQLTGTVALGALTVNSDGTVSVPVANISSNIEQNTIDAPFDPTGSWLFAKYDKTIPTGHANIGDACTEMCEGGPNAGDPIYMHRITGKEFTPDSTCSTAAGNNTFDGTTDTCNGTTGTDDVYAIQVWMSQTAMASCGNKLGATHQDAKAYARIDLATDTSVSGSPIGDGAHTWTAGWTDGWKSTSATASRDYMPCYGVPVTLNDSTVVNGWRCVDDSAKTQTNLEGGCVNSADNSRVHVTNWSAVTSGSCSNVTDSNLPAGYTKSSCTYSNVDHDSNASTAAIDLTCTWAGKEDSGFDWNSMTNYISSGQNCSTGSGGTNPQKLASLQCYAEYYWQNGGRDETKCLKRVQTNWMADTPEEFLAENNGGPESTENLYVMELLDYNSNTEMAISANEDYYRGVQTGNSWTECKIHEEFTMTTKKRSDTQLEGSFFSEVTLLSDNAACIAAQENGTLESGGTMWFLLNKQ